MPTGKHDKLTENEIYKHAAERIAREHPEVVAATVRQCSAAEQYPIIGLLFNVGPKQCEAAKLARSGRM